MNVAVSYSANAIAMLRQQPDTLWWPVDFRERNLKPYGRESATAWIDDLRNTGLVPGQTICFMTEDILQRFTINLERGGGYQTDHPVKMFAGACLTSGEIGAYSLDDLVRKIDRAGRGKHTYPAAFSCRLAIAALVYMRLEHVGNDMTFVCMRPQ